MEVIWHYLVNQFLSAPAGITQNWSYKLRYVKGDVEIGEPSDVTSITVAGV